MHGKIWIKNKRVCFERVKKDARERWNRDLSRIEVKGGSYDEKVIFYTALYHILIHPNILQDVNGQYRLWKVTG